MVKKLFLIGILLLAIVVMLGCTSQQIQTNKETEENVEEIVFVEPKQETPVYNAPLDTSKFTKSCLENGDCIRVRVMTGAGEVQDCINSNSEYKGESSENCVCKYFSSTMQLLPNGTELTQDNYECRHIA